MFVKGQSDDENTDPKVGEEHVVWQVPFIERNDRCRFRYSVYGTSLMWTLATVAPPTTKLLRDFDIDVVDALVSVHWLAARDPFWKVNS